MPDSQPRIFTLPGGTSRVYLIANDSRSVLVDAGNPGRSRQILAAAAAAGVSPSAIALIVITHTHFDHVGSLAALKKATRAPVLVHAAEAPWLRQGSSPFPAGTNLWGHLVSALGQRFLGRFTTFTPLEAELQISQPYSLHHLGIPASVLPTPGHSPGSLSLILNQHTALVGDSLFGILPHTAFPPFAGDPALLLQSWRALLGTGCTIFLPGHGRPVSRSLLEKSLAEQERKAL
jgi:hydroxyacylglutathione hydrolase